MEKLTERQRRFVDEYIITGNAMQSAIKAGYSKKYAKANSYKLLDNSGIKESIEIERKRAEKHLRERFSFDAEIARDVLFQLMNDKDVPDNVRLSAAKDFLDRAGHKPVERQEVETNGNLGIKVVWADDNEED